MKRQYFISFDIYGDGINNFASGIIDINLDNESIVGVAKSMYYKSYPEHKNENLTFKIISFNNIE